MINHFGVSGGKDSTALLLWAVRESGYPIESIRATFCDTGNEAPETLEYIKYLSENVHPIETIYPELGFYDLVMKEKRFPGVRARFCTKHLKLEPTRTHTLKLIEEHGDILLHSGIRRAESYARAKQTEEYVNDPFFDCLVRRPLLGWSIDDVWAIHARYGIRRNPLYDEGMTRVGCFPCVLGDKESIGRVARNHPERIAFIRSKEKEACEAAGHNGVTFFQRSKVPMRYWGHQSTRHKDSERTKKGEIIHLATIDDIARWALTAESLYQEDFDFDLDEIEEGGRYCPSMLGVCE